MKTDKHAAKSGHLFSLFSEACVYCGISQNDDCIENKPCPNKPKKQYIKFALMYYRNGGNVLYRVKSNKPIKIDKVAAYMEKNHDANFDRDSLELVDDAVEEIKL